VISGRIYEEAGGIRTAEAQKPCQLPRTESIFADQVNGRIEVTYGRYKEHREILEAQRPEVALHMGRSIAMKTTVRTPSSFMMHG
jgi:hypothetical protein